MQPIDHCILGSATYTAVDYQSPYTSITAGPRVLGNGGSSCGDGGGGSGGGRYSSFCERGDHGALSL